MSPLILPPQATQVGLAVDVAAFAMHAGELQVLLIRRGELPHAQTWALPGGFVQPGEELHEAALRELAAGVPDLVLFTTFDSTTSPVLEPVRRRIVFYNNVVRELSVAYNAILVDHTRLSVFRDRRMWAPDRIHMSRHGHKVLAAEVLKTLGIPHTLKVPEFPPWERRPMREAARAEAAWVRHEVIPLFRRRMRGVREGDSLSPKWPTPVHPADGMKRLARTDSGDALRVHREWERSRSHHPPTG